MKIFNKFRRKLNKTNEQKDVQDQKRDFSLYSGERQTAECLEEIRFDHKVRYDCAFSYLNKNEKNGDKLFGLDIFSGNGYGTKMMANLANTVMLGLEGSEDAVSFANKYFNGDNIYYSYKIFPFALPEKTYHFVTCFESLEHIEDDSLLLKQLGQSLKKDGLLFISFPNQDLLPFNPDFHSFHFRHYEHDGFLELLQRTHPFELISWYGQNVYNMNEPGMKELDKSSMQLVEHIKGQFMLYILKNKAI